MLSRCDVASGESGFSSSRPLPFPRLGCEQLRGSFFFVRKTLVLAYFVSLSISFCTYFPFLIHTVGFAFVDARNCNYVAGLAGSLGWWLGKPPLGSLERGFLLLRSHVVSRRCGQCAVDVQTGCCCVTSLCGRARRAGARRGAVDAGGDLDPVRALSCAFVAGSAVRPPLVPRRRVALLFGWRRVVGPCARRSDDTLCRAAPLCVPVFRGRVWCPAAAPRSPVWLFALGGRDGGNDPVLSFRGLAPRSAAGAAGGGGVRLLSWSRCAGSVRGSRQERAGTAGRSLALPGLFGSAARPALSCLCCSRVGGGLCLRGGGWSNPNCCGVDNLPLIPPR